MDVEEPPLVQLVNAILLASLEKDATQIRLRPPNQVLFVIGASAQLELAPPHELYARIIRRLSVMANLPVYQRHEAARGRIHIRVGRFQEARWTIEVAGHGPTLAAHLEAVAAADDVPAPPYRS